MTTIQKLIALQVVTALVAIAAMVAVVVVVKGEAAGRRNARYDSCFLLRGIVLTATPPNRAKRAQAFIAATPLSNCVSYSRR